MERVWPSSAECVLRPMRHAYSYLSVKEAKNHRHEDALKRHTHNRTSTMVSTGVLKLYYKHILRSSMYENRYVCERV